ncbi:DinB family protein [Mucilaginibacter sp. S1162]|uniref:DinB family protein n=1 Tax=Mucilaginibacter humi TaxID=2732510 RepID=A0ABX1W0U1_9SPHI|nr:DinB family protein [Mucilaginibacter humi]NNU33213.1 DinB family protein [Mucilaginibacter humi]
MDQQQLFVKMAVDGWNQQLKFTNDTLDKILDEELLNEISPGKNRGIYLLGHLVAVHDLMLPLLRFEEALYPELVQPFIKAPDKTVADLPPVSQLREQWNIVNDKLAAHINNLSPADWFTRHNSVSEEDFAKEPHRNRLNVLMGRTSHLANHRGQIVLLVPKSK